MSNFRQIGQQWKIFQLNVEGISRAKSDVLENFFREHAVDMAVIQETHSDSLNLQQKTIFILVLSEGVNCM